MSLRSIIIRDDVGISMSPGFVDEDRNGHSALLDLLPQIYSTLERRVPRHF